MTPPSPAGPSNIAHRGASGIALENTLEAFRAAAREGADGVELDVHTTSDGVFVVHHDPALPGLGSIAELTWETASGARLGNGERPPTLEEALETLRGLDVWVEVKALPADRDGDLLRLLGAGPTPGRYAVHSFDHRIIARLGRLAPDLPTGILSSSYPLDLMAQFDGTGARTLWQEWTMIDRALVEAVHASGRQVIAWTVNSAEAAGRLAAWGVDGLCGNWPDRLRVRSR